MILYFSTPKKEKASSQIANWEFYDRCVNLIKPLGQGLMWQIASKDGNVWHKEYSTIRYMCWAVYLRCRYEGAAEKHIKDNFMDDLFNKQMTFTNPKDYLFWLDIYDTEIRPYILTSEWKVGAIAETGYYYVKDFTHKGDDVPIYLWLIKEKGEPDRITWGWHSLDDPEDIKMDDGPTIETIQWRKAI